MSTQHHSLVTVTVNGRPWGEFETRTGGGTSAEVGKYRPSGGAKQKTRSGQPEYDDVVVGRSWERERDADLARTTRPLVGLADVIVSDQPLGDDLAPWGKPTIYTGKLSNLVDGDSDANSNDGKMLELTIVVTEVV